ncbi:TerC family protein [Candidatus Formimonas warabiya]|uniref:TerC family protein n=1 Tax=Formimonas warabiya TaxID=1761012 RepID=A0A3G1KPF4_FORW1|nr:TerC family protein [Candidatus Formimonas warabiya]ATW24349.1 hypothetical protein DCMF_05725 [Candidatus Formimonas warabiya]
MNNILQHFSEWGWLWHNFSAVICISVIDLVLSGDNAAVIGLAIRNLPRTMQRKAALFGAVGAILLRVSFTIFAVYLLTIKYLSATGGAILLWITYKLIKSNGQEAHIQGANKFWRAVVTIVIADLSMAFDNVMGVAGAAHGNPWLVIFGLLLSIPILVLGSTWLAKLMGRHPMLIYFGAAILMHTATSMFFHDQALGLEQVTGKTLAVLIPWICSIFVLFYGFWATKEPGNGFK